MTEKAVRSVGTQLLKGAVAIAGLKSIDGLDLTSETIDTTTLDSDGGYREFIGGFKDAGEISISGFFYPTSQAGLREDFESQTEASYTIKFPNKYQWTFKAIVTGFKTGAELEDAITFECTLKVSGKPELSQVTGE